VGSAGGVSVGLVGGCSHGEAVEQKGALKMNAVVRQQPRPNVRRGRKSRNEVRADRVRGPLEYYRVTGLREVGASLDTVISDLLSDLRHLCDRAEIDLSRVDRLAHLNYLNEKYRR
jgi:hypothetical protein